MQELPNNNGQSIAGTEHSFLTVGIGASAGGIRALQTFFSNTPPDSGMAYVVIVHLSPDHDSKLAEVLSTTTQMPVAQVNDTVKIKPDHVYVISPNRHLSMVDGTIASTENLEIEDRRAPVDIFFRTLAESHGPGAVGVVLSGTGANGSMGLKRIKENGGAAYAQSPAEAEFSEMPRHSIATGLVDEILRVSEIPSTIIAYRDSLGKLSIPKEAEDQQENFQRSLREVLSQLRIHTGHDFANYKRQTILRRIERRISIHNLPDLAAYAQFIKTNVDEVTALLKDLLISVTNFFRDKLAFDEIANRIIPDILQHKKKEDHIRIWVPGCATGEEAYSLAMICAEKTLNLLDAPKIQIFATDIDETAIAVAREGLYTLNDAADISPERLKNFFSKEGERYRVQRHIRETILFATHNFIKDPPFSHLDLVSCRNVLIYLNRLAQERVMETFHFALNPGAFLFLGSSESIEGANDLFSAFNRDFHIFQSRNVAARSFPVPESVPIVYPERYRNTAFSSGSGRTTDRITYAELHQRLVEEYAPPSVVVNEEYDIVHMSATVGQYFQVAGGEPSQNLLRMVKTELRLELRSALYQATQQQSPVQLRSLHCNINGIEETVRINVRPVMRENDPAKGFILVIFEKALPEEAPVTIEAATDEPVSKQLERELVRVKSQLRAAMEQHDFHAEELKASNEELQAMNEELRSAAEELETSKEELQSINEELRTVNQELKIKIEETTLGNNNLQNLINSVGVITIFLDRNFSVVFFTPAARSVFSLLPSDLGRPLSDITSQLNQQELLADSRSVLDNLHVVEKEVASNDGRVFMMKTLPYRTAEDHISGVVITLFDITARKIAEERLRTSEARFRNIVTHTSAGISEMALDGKYIFSNERFRDILGFSETDMLTGMSIHDITFADDRASLKGQLEKCATEGVPFIEEKRYVRKNGTVVWVLDSVSLIRNGDGRPRNLINVTLDIDERKVSEEALNRSEERFKHLSESGLLSIAFFTSDGIVEEANESFLNLTGYSRSQMNAGQIRLDELTPPEWTFRTHSALEELKGTGKIMPFEKESFRRDGTRFWGLWGGSAYPEKNGHISFVLDINSIKALERQKDVFIGIASHELKTPVTSIKAYAELLKEILENAPDKEPFELASRLDGQISRLTKLIHSLLDTTKITEGRLMLQAETFDLNGLVREQAEEMQRISAQHPIQLVLGEVDDVVGDRERIGQVITNIVSNAIKYSPDKKEIIVSTAVEDGFVKVGIRDFGIGVPTSAHSKIFDRFYREHNKQIDAIPGIGLGLYISAEIIKQHGGEIGVMNAQGEGALFYFKLPYHGK